MSISIKKDIYVRDKFGVRRRAWLAGEQVEPHVYNAVLRTNTVVNPEDLDQAPVVESTPSLHSKPMETKVLPDEPVVEQPVVKKASKAGRKKKASKK